LRRPKMDSKLPSPEIDSDLKRRVINYLSQRYSPALRAIEIEAHDGSITLRGKVRSFYARQLCIHCCQRVAGVAKLDDQIEVSDG